VLLTDPEMQAGLQAAVDELKAVRESIELITDNLDVYEFGNPDSPTGEADVQRKPTFTPRPPQTPDERQQRLSNLIEQGVVRADVQKMPEAEQDRAIVAGETWQHMSDTPLFGGDLPEAPKPGTETAPAKPNFRAYPLRRDLDLPKALIRELPPDPAKLNDL